MTGLNLINTYYSSDTEDNEEDNKDDTIASSLPLPESIALWKGVSHHEDIVDDTSKHNGRIRSFKHERGNWATLIYINYTGSDVMIAWMNSILKYLPVRDFILFEQFHISLSKTLILKFHWIESFVTSLKQLCQSMSRFTLELTNVKTYCNEERTRTFLGISCHNNTALSFLTKSLDELLDEYQLPPFYKDPSYHISFCWCLGDKEACLNDTLSIITSSFNTFLIEHTEENYVHINELHCKIGNKFYTFQLK